MKVKNGDEFWCANPRLTRNSDPKKGKIIALTTSVGKHIAMEFYEEVPGGHTCDGRGTNKRCLWVHPSDLLTDDMILKLRADLATYESKRGIEIEQLDIDE